MLYFYCPNCKKEYNVERKRCGSVPFQAKTEGNSIRLYCSVCGAWIKWIGKDEARAFEHSQKPTKNDIIECDIPLGSLCCFKPLASNAIYFGHMAGKVVDDFEKMTWLYVLDCDDRYFFSRNVIVKPNDVHTSNEAKRYFDFE